MVIIQRFILMVQFLTIIPIPMQVKARGEDYGKGLIFAPIIGLILGAILLGIFTLCSLFLPINISTLMVVVIYIILTGGLHFDGLGDTFDGLFSNRSKDRMLEIMRDSHVGTNAVLAVVSVLMLDFALLSGITASSMTKAVLLMPVAGRIGSLIGAGTSRYARSTEGLGKSFIDYCGKKEIAIGLVFYLFIFWVIGGMSALILSIVPVLSAFLLIKFFSRKIGGATGDILGAVCELNQTIFLLSLYIWTVFGVKLL